MQPNTLSRREYKGKIYVFSKKQEKTWHLIILANSAQKNLKITSAYTESTDLIFVGH
jgi:hypothetical protein